MPKPTRSKKTVVKITANDDLRTYFNYQFGACGSIIKPVKKPDAANVKQTTTWGSQPTQFFYSLTPDKVLDAFEGASGTMTTGYCVPLASYENRVYEVELDQDGPTHTKRRVLKFYRPGRWSRAQIEEEHLFLRDLEEAEVRVVPPLPFADGSFLKETPEGIFFCVFQKVGGRAPEDLDSEKLKQLGRTLGRLHMVGRKRKSEHRLTLNATTYGEAAKQVIFDSGRVPRELETRMLGVVDYWIKTANEKLSILPTQRIHGDCHGGNILWQSEGPCFVDFDDMVVGPQIQDLWLLSFDEEGWQDLLEGYSDFSELPQGSLDAIPSLRALRIMHYAAWLTKRYEDPAFQRAFPHFESSKYWFDLTQDLENLLQGRFQDEG